jgi:UDP-2-acetamido-3-amino-2,3-dideoxy-glucuronate N-acetyltransferase
MSTIAVIGCGYWGKNLIRNFSELKALHTLYDTDEKRLEQMKSLYTSVKIANNLAEVLGDDSIEGVVVATPAESHYEIAKEALLAGKDVFVEKPLALRVKTRNELVVRRPKVPGMFVNAGFGWNSTVPSLGAVIVD